MDGNLKREIILDNYENPYNRGLIDDDTYLKTRVSSDSCIDEIDVMMKIVDDKIVDIRFDGEACVISTAATSIMIRNLIGKSVGYAKKLLLNYNNMINELDYDKEMLGELGVYDEICKQPNRKGCALVPSKAISKILEKLK